MIVVFISPFNSVLSLFCVFIRLFLFINVDFFCISDTVIEDTSPMPAENNDILPLSNDIVNNSSLPWQDNLDPSPTHLADSIPNNEPVIAHVPSWVNNLSYSHITETGSPYVSPQTTVIPQKSDYHKTVYSLFSDALVNNNVESNTTDANDNVQNGVNSSEYFPPPWGDSVSEDCPQLSPMTMEAAIRSEELLHSAHMEQAPEHHHVIIPSNHHLFIDSSNSSTKHGGGGGHLTEVASAPDFQHWRPIRKGSFMDESSRLQSDTMLTEMAFQEGVKSRVQEWLKMANDDEENDADEEDEDGSDVENGNPNNSDEEDGLDCAEEIERELDIAMSLDKKHL